ncbi:hypothetical protein VNO78_16905 [Psophocarpus tetragonolobus]|uniref:Uncharacterized protein n=1 Tax=Psophocarpus tetragonolobus TaxID=3891 RepID=A0AAN9SG76_PSOTE
MVHVIGPFGYKLHQELEFHATHHSLKLGGAKVTYKSACLGPIEDSVEALGTVLAHGEWSLEGKEMNMQQPLPVLDELKQLGVVSIPVVMSGCSSQVVSMACETSSQAKAEVSKFVLDSHMVFDDELQA